MGEPDKAGGFASDGSHLHDDLIAEYFKLVDLVTAADQRLLTIKGWGVTLSLASLGLAFQQEHYGLFLVAAVSALAFWIVEGTTKFHQMRYYPRMGDIEHAAFELYGRESPTGVVSSPLIDWSWHTATPRVSGGGPINRDPRVPQRWPDNRDATLLQRIRGHPMLFLNVVFPHLITIIAGTVLFFIGLLGHLGPI